MQNLVAPGVPAFWRRSPWDGTIFPGGVRQNRPRLFSDLHLPVHLGTALHKLHRLGLHALFKRLLGADALGGGGQGGQADGKDMDGDGLRQLKEVEKQLRQSQASNLVQAQQAYSLDNAKKLGAIVLDSDSDGAFDAKGLSPFDSQTVRYDTDAAERQLEKLQKAQEVTVATVQPLRVNLPLRGQRHVFTQVLQTEVNKPMTVEFAARNLKAGGWLKPIALTFAAFLALWIAVAIYTPRREA